MLTDRPEDRFVRCAVWGRPIAHSLSPVLHRAAYDALGLLDWTYDRREVDEEGFAAALAALDDDWRGLSLTMPLKEAALAAAAATSSTARAAGAANTLVRERSGWTAHNTDVADSWEREGEDPGFFYQFSPDGYALGIDVLLYVLTH